MKVIIEDHAKRISSNKDEKEQELPPNTVIRFEVGKNKFICSIVDGGIKVYKMSDTFDESVKIEPTTTNQVLIK